jgi:hypothetical protein
MSRWQRHLPMANASLWLTSRRAAQSGVQFSPAERSLFMACEFWTAVCRRSLAMHLGVDSIDTLRCTSMVYSAIGAHSVASAMFVAIGELQRAAHPQQRHGCVATLQERLLKTGDPVDQLIARLAENLGLGLGSSSKWAPASEVISIPA